MADNITLNAGSGGSDLATDEISSVHYQKIKLALGAADTANLLSVGAGAVDTGVPRITLASDDPAVALLGTIDTDTGAIATSIASIDGKITACNTGAVVISSGTITTVTTVTTVSAVTAITNALPAGDNNIGNVDVVTLPIDFNAGAVGATTPRFTLASDDPAVALLGTIDTDTGNIATAASSIDGKITACNTGAVTISASALPTGAATSSLQTTIKNSVQTIEAAASSIEGNITACDTGNVTIGAALPAGTNAIGKLAANDGVDIGDVDVTSIAAGTNTIGGTISQQSTSVAYDGTTACTIKRATGLAASGTVAMVAAVSGKKIRCLALALFATSATATNVYVANADNNILGDASNPIPLAVDADGDNVGGFILPWNPGGWFETDTANEDLNVVLSAAQDVIYAITYIEVA